MKPITRHELRRAIGETLAKLHWLKYHTALAATPEWQGKEDRLFGLAYDRPALIAELKDLLHLQKTRQFVDEINARGNTIIRWFRSGADRLHWDFGPCTRKRGWRQFDTHQDASYFGVWVHVERRLVLTYCEGDCSLVICPDQAHLKAELDDAERFYGPTPPCMVAGDGFDSAGKLTNATAYYDERPKAAL